MMDQFGFSEYERASNPIDRTKITDDILERPVSLDESDLEYMHGFAKSIILAEGKSELPDEDVSEDSFYAPGWISKLYKNSEYAPYIERMFGNILGRCGKPITSFSAEKRTEMDDKISQMLVVIPETIPQESSKEYFKGTNLYRNFIGNFKHKSGSGVDHKPITHTLFGIPSFQIGINPTVELQEAIKYIKQSINNKKILLLGGGNSVSDLIYNNKEFSPKHIINADPHFINNDTNTSTPNPYKRLNVKAEDDSFAEKIKQAGMEQADEIWATFSVPYYLDSKEKIKKMFENATKILAPGGVLRIHPFVLPQVGIDSFAFGDKKASTDVFKINDDRLDGLIESLREINDDSGFNVSIVNINGGMSYSTLLIQRCS